MFSMETLTDFDPVPNENDSRKIRKKIEYQNFEIKSLTKADKVESSYIKIELIALYTILRLLYINTAYPSRSFQYSLYL